MPRPVDACSRPEGIRRGIGEQENEMIPRKPTMRNGIRDLPPDRRQRFARRRSSGGWLAAQVSLLFAGALLLTRVSLAERVVGARPPDAPGAIAPQPDVKPSDTIGILDFYGLRTVPEPQARKAVGFKEGDPMPQSAAAIAAAVQR